MRRDFFENLRMFCVLGALLIIGLVMLSALVAGCKPVNEVQSSEAGKSGDTCFKIVTVDGHDYILAKDIDYCSIALTHHAGCVKCAEERRRAVYEDLLCASTGNDDIDIKKLKNEAVAEGLRQRELVLDGFRGKER